MESTKKATAAIVFLVSATIGQRALAETLAKPGEGAASTEAATASEAAPAS